MQLLLFCNEFKAKLIVYFMLFNYPIHSCCQKKKFILFLEMLKAKLQMALCNNTG